MVLTSNAKNRIRDLISADITGAEFGTDGTSATSGDTDLGTPFVAADTIPTITTGEKLLNITSVMVSTTGNGNTFKEGGVKLTGDILLDRYVYPDFVKDINNSMTITDVIRVS